MHAKGFHSMRALVSVLPLLHFGEASLKAPRWSPRDITSWNDVSSTLHRSVDSTSSETNTSCRYLPGDVAWPSEAEWSNLNNTVGGRLIRGTPLAEGCFGGSNLKSAACSSLHEERDFVGPYILDPVNVMSPYWHNNSCNPWLNPGGTCTLGNIAPYAINVSDASTVIAGIKFAQEKNIRLSIKNTGHDYLGRSSGEGSLALWTHNLKGVSFFNYTGSTYTGPAVRVGAGVLVHEVYELGSKLGYRVVGGGCPTVGLAGGWLTGGGHGPLTAAYGLGADNALEFEVVTATGDHLVASSTQNPDLFWALSGGGGGNYAVVLSLTLKAHVDGPVAGTVLAFSNTNPEAFWSAIAAWMKRLLVIDVEFPRFSSASTFTNDFFALDFASLPDATEADINTAIGPFLEDLRKLNITASRQTVVSPTFYAHYQHFTSSDRINSTNETVSNRLIPRSLVQQRLPTLINTIRSIAANNTAAVFVIVNNNVSHANVGNPANAVLPAWRDSLFLLNFGLELASDAAWAEIQSHQAQVNAWMRSFRDLTPGGGSYMNEATWNDETFKVDYFGANYDRLSKVKAKYDPAYVFFANAAVGSDVVWRAREDGSGRLCRRI